MTGNSLADWLDADEVLPQEPDIEDTGGGARWRRVRVLLVGGAIFWAAAVAVLVVASAGPFGSTTPSSTAGPAEEQGDGHGGADSSTPEPSSTTSAMGEAPAPAITSDTIVPSHLAALAVVAVRLEVSRLTPEQDDTRYVDAALAEHVEHVDDFAVVRVLAVVLEGGMDGWERTSVHRYAVPLAVSENDEPFLAGSPWLVDDSVSTEIDEPDWRAVDAPIDAITQAVENSGFSGVTDLDVAGIGSAVLKVTFTASAPAGSHDVWMTPAPEFRLLGLPSSP